MTLDLPQAGKNPIWIHACSVGEVASVAPLIEALLKRSRPLHLTVVTDTGYSHARKLFADRISLSYLPWDVPGLMYRMLKRLNPHLLLLTETEFWPGMLHACKKRGIPVLGINTRISDRSYPRYRASRLLWKRWLSDISLFLAQSEIDATRLAGIGVDTSHIRCLGHLKYAVSVPEVDSEALRRRLDATGSRPILLAGSTHDNEEEQLCRYLAGWRQLAPDLLLVIVPRRPRRFDEVANLLTAQGLRTARWSKGYVENGLDAVLIDEMGVLSGLYSVADLVFIGGSLIPHGGQNPLEAAVCGRGVLTGPHMHNFQSIMQDMQQAGAAVQCADAAELDAAVLRFLAHPDELKELHAHAAAFMQNRTDIAERMLEAIKPWIDASPDPAA